MPPVKRAVLVLGMHRSGTSLCARIVNLMGFAVPKTLMPATEANAEGYWESELISQLNDRLLSACGVEWHTRGPLNADPLKVARASGLYGELRRAIAGEFAGAERIVLKDPRICRLVPLYGELLADEGYRITPILALRNPGRGGGLARQARPVHHRARGAHLAALYAGGRALDARPRAGRGRL